MEVPYPNGSSRNPSNADQSGQNVFLNSSQPSGYNHAPFQDWMVQGKGLEGNNPHENTNSYHFDYNFGQETQHFPQANFTESSNPGSHSFTNADSIATFQSQPPSHFSTPSGADFLQDSCNNAVVSTYNDTSQLNPLHVTTDKPQNPKTTEASVEPTRPSTGRTRVSPRGPPPSTHAKPVGKSPRLTAQDRARAVAKKSQRAPPSNAPAGEKPDPFTQWYQMMSQYYSQFYPGYQLPQPPGSSVTNQPVTGNQSASETTPRHLNLKAATTQPTGPSYLRPGLPATQPTSAAGTAPGAFDYASYYYQYYYGTAASQFWPGSQLYPGLQPSGRKTPKFFHTPHIRAYLTTPGIVLQVLPSRPSDGEIARIEMLDLGELASEAVAEAAKRVSEADVSCANLTRLNELAIDREQENIRDGYSSGASGLDSPGQLSSLQAGAGGDDGEAVRACAAVAVAWDRTDHMMYPGPLSRSSTLKADVLAFLREKLAEIQDRLPIDWESAGLLIAYLETMVKNNGNVQASDLVNLLLEGHEPQTSELRARGTTNASASCTNIGVSPQYPNNRVRPYLSDSLASLSPSQPPSGRQSPQTPVGVPQVNMSGQQAARAASETGGFINTQALLRRAAAAAGTLMSDQRNTEAEDKILDRFRELLMHGMAMKALEHACRYQLWGHAFVLGQRIGPSVFDKVMDRFLSRAIPVADPILTLYQLTAGEMPQAVTATAYGRGADNGEWRPHLAMILAAESSQPELAQSALERLGDSLLSRRLVYAAHLCYLLMGPLCKQSKGGRGQPVYQLPDRIWLLGVPPVSADATDLSTSHGHSPLSATTEAIQLTEIYEYAMKLANRNYRLPQLLPFKLIYATRLMDAGLMDKANRYLNAIGTDLLLEAADIDFNNESNVPPVLYSLVANCIRLAEPLQYHPELDGFESTAFGSGARSPGTPVPGRSNAFMRFGAPSTHTGSSTGWLDRLRQLYYEMHNRLPRPNHGFVNSQSSSQPHAAAIKEESSPVQHPVHQSTGSNHQVGVDSYHAEVHGDPHAYSSSGVGSSSSGHPVSAYLVPAQTYPQAQPLESSSPPSHSSVPAHSSSGVNSHTLSSTTWPTTSHSHVSQVQNQMVHDSRRSLDQSESATPVNMQNVQIQGPHHQPHQPLRLPDEAYAPQHTPSNTATSIPYPQMMASDPGQSTLYSHSDASDSYAPRQHPMPVSVDQPMQHNMFFTPFAPSSPPNTPGTGSTSAFDYFAELQAGRRSRTVSGGSQSSQAGPAPPSAQGHSQASRSRSNSGNLMNQPRRNSGSFDRPSTAHSPQLQMPRHMSEFQRAPIKEEQQSGETKPDEEDHPGMTNQQAKEGWLSNWLGRLKRNGSKNIHLPDDSKPSIVWDDKQKQWIDTSNPQGREPTPPPPPMSSMNLPTNPQFSNQSASPNAPSNPSIPRVSSRSRYVNVLANQTSGPAASKLDGPLQPPLPPTVFAPYPNSARQDRFQNDDNLRPNRNQQPLDMSNAYRTTDGSSSLMVKN